MKEEICFSEAELAAIGALLVSAVATMPTERQQDFFGLNINSALSKITKICPELKEMVDETLASVPH